ncbi:MAG TPA: cyclodeaminase/cyclohydrolase family protein, partial [Bacteroidales bacterium]|nr:cyclodeaminase/cyclohydrolase family protein [Bacteroidales bacterium]
IKVPFRVMEKSLASMEVRKAMAETGMAASAADVGVGALCARTAVMGAYLNVKINAGGLEDKAFAEEMVKKGEEIVEKARILEDEILAVVEKKIRKI